MKHQLLALVRRNFKLFFKDKGTFFCALITPAILLVLYVSFLGKVYEDAIILSLPQIFSSETRIIGALVGGQLLSSLLAVCCVTVAFCSNLIMIQDKANGARRDLEMAPVRGSTLALGYFIASAFTTMVICLVALFLGFIYLGIRGWYLSFVDVLMILLDMLLLVLFGTSLSSLIHYPLSTQGQASAVGTIVSSGYGFICGAYMPISNFGKPLQIVLSFLPGTYGTSLMRRHCMRGAISALEEKGSPEAASAVLSDAMDANLYFFDHYVSDGAKLLILFVAVILLVGGYVLLCIRKEKRREKQLTLK